jgi:hypothetical protein
VDALPSLPRARKYCFVSLAPTWIISLTISENFTINYNNVIFDL